MTNSIKQIALGVAAVAVVLAGAAGVYTTSQIRIRTRHRDRLWGAAGRADPWAWADRWACFRVWAASCS